MTEIGYPRRVKRGIPEPIKAPAIPIPVKPWKEPVPVRREPERVLEPARVWERIGMFVEEIPYSCPKCGRQMEMEDGVLSCPVHGVVYSG